MEKWMPVKGFKGKYEVSDLGRVRSFFMWNGREYHQRKEPLILAPRTDRDGYVQVAINRKDHKVHRLVLETFVGKCPPKAEGSHLDGNPANNNLTNLAWETRSQNHQRKREHGTDHGGYRNPNAALTEEKVVEIRTRYARGEKMVDLAPEFGVSKANVGQIVIGKTWQFAGGPITRRYKSGA